MRCLDWFSYLTLQSSLEPTNLNSKAKGLSEGRSVINLWMRQQYQIAK